MVEKFEDILESSDKCVSHLIDFLTTKEDFKERWEKLVYEDKDKIIIAMKGYHISAFEFVLSRLAYSKVSDFNLDKYKDKMFDICWGRVLEVLTNCLLNDIWESFSADFHRKVRLNLYACYLDTLNNNILVDKFVHKPKSSLIL